MKKTIFLLVLACLTTALTSCEKDDDTNDLYATEWVYQDDTIKVSFSFVRNAVSYHREYKHQISKITYHYYLDSSNIVFTDNLTNDSISAYFICNNRIHLYDPVIGDIIVLTKK